MSHNNHQFLHKKSSRKRRLEAEPEVFQGEQKRMRRLLVLAQIKDATPRVAEEVKQARAETERAKLVSLVTR